MRFIKRTAPRNQVRPPRALGLALDAHRGAALQAVLLFALMLVTGLLVGGGSHAQGQGIQIDVTQCPEDAADPASCERSSQRVGRERPSSRRGTSGSSQPRGSRPTGGAEVHTVDLKKGKAKVETSAGTETVDVDLTVSPDEDAPPPRKPPKIDPQTKSDVSTTGGAVPAPGAASSPFEFVSSDEALSQFAVPPFLVPIYVAAGRAYGVPWNVLAAINRIETDFGRNLNVSSAGAMGWMQFIPSSWRAYGVDASGDGVADPYNPVDAIYAAARYLKAAGAARDLRRAIFAYNHADWYVDIVLKNAGVYGSLPEGLVAETGSLAFGRFPVRGRVSYGDDFRRAQIARRRPQGLWIDGRPGARAIATQNVTVKRILLDRALVATLRREGELPSRGLARPLGGKVARLPSPARLREAVVALDVAASRLGALRRALTGERSKPASVAAALARWLRRVGDPGGGERIAGLPKGYAIGRVPGVTVEVVDLVGNTYGYAGLDRVSAKVRPGSTLRGGQLVGRLPRGAGSGLLFSTRAAGGALVDPRPLVDGYRLQETADFFHAVAPMGGSPFVRSADKLASAGVKGGSARELAQRVLRDPGIDIYPCGRQDIAQGKTDRRVLGALLYLRSAGMTLRVTSLTCGHSFYTSGGGISAHSFGAAVDIAAFNGQPVIGNQGPGSLTEQAIKLLMKLEGAARPKQLISLMSLGGPSFAMGDHHDHLHVGYSFTPSLGLGRSGRAAGPVDFTASGTVSLSTGKVEPDVERRLSRKLSGIQHPTVRDRRSPGSLKVPGRGHAHTEYRRERAQAEALEDRRDPLRLAPTAAGARILDVDVPAGARGDEAYAVGIVNGTARGWARRQHVVLAHRDERWRLVGPPRDTRGRAVNPRLRALSTVTGGTGFAVGDRGAVVSLRTGAVPRLQRRVTGAKLRAVDVARRRGRLAGYAAGSRGTVVRLAGGPARIERVGSVATELRDVTVAGGRVLAVGAGGDAGDAALFERRNGGWEPVSPAVKAPAEASLRLAAVAARGGQLWIAGGRVDSRIAGAAAEQPFAARLSGGRWTTYCSVPAALVAVAELGEPTTHSGCDKTLTPDPADSGAATGIALTRAGVVIATSRGPQVLAPDSDTFRPVPGAATGYVPGADRPAGASLAISRQGEGWAFDTKGRMTRVLSTPASAGSGAETPGEWRPLAWSARGKPAALAVAPGGERALAFGGGGGALYAAGRWTAAPGFDFGLRDVAWAGERRIWGLTVAGDLVRRDSGAWEIGAPGASGLGGRLEQLVKLSEALGSAELSPGTGAGGEGGGLRALAFASDAEGYAVGAGGAIERSDGTSWKREDSTTTEDLEAVAAGPGGTIAAGAHGTLLRRHEHGWRPVPAASRLVGDEGFTAAAALADGTLLASAGGAIIATKGEAEWKAAEVPPLATAIERLGGYRDLGGRLHVLALVDTGAGKVLLDGDRGGWQPVGVPGGVQVIDAQLSSGSGRLWVLGLRGARPVAARVSPPARTASGSGNFLDGKSAEPFAAKSKEK